MRTTEATVAATMIRRKDILAVVMSIKKKRNSLAAATKIRRKVIPAAVIITKKMNITANETTIKIEPALSFHDKAGLSFISVAFNYCFLN